VGTEPRAAVVVLQEWWGLDEHIKDVTRRLANADFVALAPDLYHGVVTTEPDEARKQVMALDMAEAVREIQQAVTFLLAQPFVAGEKVGIVGFCMGGGLALETALVEDELGAVVAYYGSPLEPEKAKDVKAPVLGLYGAKDQGIAVDRVKAMEQALKAAGVVTSIQVYEGAEHAFLNNTRPSYNQQAADDAWAKTLAWFREYLKM
jgi:carboxymethylenebutenolidase